MGAKPQKLSVKYCAYPNCGVEFIGRGKAKYCDEHRKAIYRKDLYQQNDNDGSGIVDIIHDEACATEIYRECALDGCNNMYKVILIPKLFQYPSYCEDHRNMHKRIQFLNTIK